MAGTGQRLGYTTGREASTHQKETRGTTERKRLKRSDSMYQKRGGGCRVFTCGGGGGSKEPPKTGGGGFGKRAQLTGPFITYYEFWRRRCF